MAGGTGVDRLSRAALINSLSTSPACSSMSTGASAIDIRPDRSESRQASNRCENSTSSVSAKAPAPPLIEWTARKAP